MNNLLTIVTPVFNADKSLSVTLESISPVKTTKVNHLFLDSESKDNTQYIINDYIESKVVDSECVIEKDGGIYDALNKAMFLSKSKYIMILHSGDAMNILISDLIDVIELNDGYDIYAFSGGFSEDNGIRFWNRKEKHILSLSNPSIMHPCLIIKRSVLIDLNGYDLKYKISADFDLIVRYLNLKSKSKIFYSEQALLIMEPFGFSANKNNFVKKKFEHFKIASQIKFLSLHKWKLYYKTLKHLVLGYIKLSVK
jgi:glycosyltransferase